MIELGGGKIWFTAAEIADLSLPGLPRSKRKVNERADMENWALAVDDAGTPRARPRKGRGGGLEYHLSMLPDAARAELVKRGLAFAPANDEDTVARHAHGWAWYDMQSDAVKGEAMRRALIIAQIDACIATGMPPTAAVTSVSQSEKVSMGTLYNLLKLVKGAPGGTITPIATITVAAPSFLSVVGGVGQATIRLRMPDAPFAYVRLFGGATNVFTSASQVGPDRVHGLGEVIEVVNGGLVSGARYYWARAYSTGGGSSALAGPEVATVS